MNTPRSALFWAVCCLFLAQPNNAQDETRMPAWLPPGLPPLATEGPTLCPREYLTPEQGKQLLDATLKQFPSASEWTKYAHVVRSQIQAGAGLAPFPKRTPLNPIAHSKRTHEGYTVENIAFETVPGVWTSGNLYRPTAPATTGKFPAVLSPHGHTRGIDGPTGYDRHGRFHPDAQKRAASMARAGAVVLTLDAFGYGDSIAQFGPEAHRTPLSMRVQAWNAIRAIDFLTSLDDVDPARIGVTGESGGGTQTFLVTALDQRVAASAPVVMVSAYFFGGCPCESGRPIHRSTEHFASNAIIAALAAPRPLLLVSDGGDWTKNVPQVEFPFLQDVYRRLGVVEKVRNVHLANEGHDYGPNKRAAVYPFFAETLGIKIDVLRASDGSFDESKVVVEPASAMKTFDEAHALPENAVRDLKQVDQIFDQLQK